MQHPSSPSQRSSRRGGAQRIASLVGGWTLALVGLSRRSPIGAALTLAGGYLAYRGATGHDLLHSPSNGTAGEQAEWVDFARSITIDRPAADLYSYWRVPENLPRFMTHIKSVTRLDERRAHWVLKAPLGLDLEWDSEITEDVPNERLAWRSLEGASIENAGSVTFKEAPGNRGTEVHLRVRYDPPGGIIGDAVARFLNEVTAETIQEELRHLKQLMEAGEMARTEGQPSARTDEQPQNEGSTR